MLTLTDLDLDPDNLRDRDSIDRPDPMTPEEIAHQYWLELHDRGLSIRQIAGMTEKSHMTVFRGIKLARIEKARRLNEPPPVVPILDSAGYKKDQPCGHRGMIRRGARFYCPECHDLGTREHSGLKLNPNDPLLKQRKKPGAGKKSGRTRKERRKQLVSA